MSPNFNYYSTDPRELADTYAEEIASTDDIQTLPTTHEPGFRLFYRGSVRGTVTVEHVDTDAGFVEIRVDGFPARQDFSESRRVLPREAVTHIRRILLGALTEDAEDLPCRVVLLRWHFESVQPRKTANTVYRGTYEECVAHIRTNKLGDPGHGMGVDIRGDVPPKRTVEEPPRATDGMPF